MSDQENNGGCSLSVMFIVGGMWGLLQTLGIVDCSVTEPFFEASAETDMEGATEDENTESAPPEIAESQANLSATSNPNQPSYVSNQGLESRSLKDALRTQVLSTSEPLKANDWSWLEAPLLTDCSDSEGQTLSLVRGLDGVCLKRSRAHALIATAKPFETTDLYVRVLNPTVAPSLQLEGRSLQHLQEAAKAQNYWLRLDACQYKPFESKGLSVSCELPNLYIEAPPQRFVSERCLDTSKPCEPMVTLRQEPLTLMIQEALNLEQLVKTHVFLHFKLIDTFQLPDMVGSTSETYFKIQPQWVGWVNGQGEVLYGLQEGIWTETYDQGHTFKPIILKCDDSLCTGCTAESCSP